MEVRKLKQEEHIKTRKLWEEIFTEDTPEFLNYYYSVKTRENEIYVIEDGEKIVSMVHLNPYQMRIGDQIHQTHYIVAVATDKAYRRQGLMAKLLNHVLQVMRDRGEPFTFLMPASEAIYRPFGFTFIYEQKQCKVVGKCHEDVTSSYPARPDLEFVFANETDCKEIAEFANEYLKQYDITTWRMANYYKTTLAEQKSENGGILLAKRDGHIEGVFCFAKEEEIEIREPLFCEEELLQQAVFFLTGNETEDVLCVGYGDQTTKPMIMAKILQPDMTIDLQKAKVFLNEVV